MSSDAPRRGRPRNLTEAEARELTRKIKTSSASLWMMISEAHARKAWQALGYPSWKSYVSVELQMSEQQSFRILDAAKVMQELRIAGAPVADMTPPPARVVQIVKGDLRAVRKAAREALKMGADPLEAVRSVAREMTPPPVARVAAPPRTPPASADSAAATDAQDAAGEPGVDPFAEPPTGLPSDVAAPVIRRTPLPRGRQTCPVCGGEGNVTTATARKIRGLMSSD